MSTETSARRWSHYDKSEWGHGPWIDEPDKLQWVDEATGLDCLMVRNRSGAWCGYVGVPEGHPFFEVGYDDSKLPCSHDHSADGEYVYCEDRYINVHGGLTFADSCHEPTEAQWIAEAARANDPKLLTEAARYPKGDAADYLARARETAGQTLDEWIEGAMARRICHVPDPGRPDKVWWLGFDCAHSGDLSPAYQAKYPVFENGFYRDEAYVRREVANLAAQLNRVTLPEPTPVAVTVGHE